MVAGVTEMPLTWSVVIPVKVLARAKSRLAGLAGPARSELALAMAADTVRAAAACPAVAAVVVVTDDPAAASTLGALGARWWPTSRTPGSTRPSRTARPWPRPLARLRARPALAADLPALRPAELDRGLRAAAQWPEAFVADAEGSGTTLYAARPGGVPAAIRPGVGGALPGGRGGRDHAGRCAEPPL